MLLALRLQERLADHVRRQAGAYLVALVLFGAGCAAGLAGARALSPAQRADLVGYVGALLAHAARRPVAGPALMRAAAADNLRSLLVAWLCGLSVVGLPAVFALLVLRGFSLGFAAAFLVQELGARGAALALAGIFPAALLEAPAAAALAVGSAAYAHGLWRGQRARSRAIVAGCLASYAALLLALAFLLLVASALEGYVAPWLVSALARYLA